MEKVELRGRQQWRDGNTAETEQRWYEQHVISNVQLTYPSTEGKVWRIVEYAPLANVVYIADCLNAYAPCPSGVSRETASSAQTDDILVKEV